MKIHHENALFSTDIYLPASSIKDNEQIRRIRKSTITPNILLELENIFIEVSQALAITKNSLRYITPL